MGKGQKHSIRQRFIRAQCRWQVENQSTQLALVIIWIESMNMWYQLFHVEQKHGMATWMLLPQVKSHLRCQGSGAAEDTLCAQQLQECLVLPKSIKLPMNQSLFQSVFVCSAQLI